MNFITVGDVNLHYRLDGRSDGVPMVFVNSLGTDLRIWDGVVANLGHSFHFVRYDKRGHGLSDSPPGPYSLEDERADLAGLLAHLAVSNPIIVGISVGGLIALDFASHHAVRAMVVCDSALRFATADYWEARSAAVTERGMEAMASVLAPRWFAPDFETRQLAAFRGYVNMLARMPSSGYRATCDLLAQSDVTAAAATIDAPALVLGGAQDLSSPPEIVRRLADALRNSRFAIIENAGHLPCIEQPQAVAAQIGVFLAGLGYG